MRKCDDPESVIFDASHSHARRDDDPQREAADGEQQQQEARREAVDSGEALCVQITWDVGFSAKAKNHTKSAIIAITSETISIGSSGPRRMRGSSSSS